MPRAAPCSTRSSSTRASDAGVEFRFGVTVTALARDSRARSPESSGATPEARPFAATARMTVGADGMGSTVARLAGAQVRTRGPRFASFIYGYWDGLTSTATSCSSAPGSPPASSHQRRPGLHLRRHDAVALPVRGTARHGPRLHPAPERGRAGPVPPGRCPCARAAADLRRAAGLPPAGPRPGWALVGDAGYFKDPITSHGITDALRDAELLAGAIITAAGGDAPEAVALAGYQATRDRLSDELFTVTEAIASFRWTLDEIPALMVRLSGAMSDEVAWLTGLAGETESDRLAGFAPLVPAG